MTGSWNTSTSNQLMSNINYFFPEIWAAAGIPNAVFKLTPQDLVKRSAGQVGPVK